MDYLYYCIFIIAKGISMGLSKPHYRAAFLITLPICFNLLSLLFLLGIEIKKTQLFIYVLSFSLLYYLFLKFFLNTNRYKRVMKKYKYENAIKIAINTLIYLIYFFGSIIIFMKIKLN